MIQEAGEFLLSEGLVEALNTGVVPVKTAYFSVIFWVGT